MTTDLDTLLTALYVHVDDRLKTPRWRGRPPRLTDAELVTLAVAQAILGFHCEARWEPGEQFVVALAELAQNHWSVEPLHHIRDVTYDEDASRIRTDATPRAMATLRNLESHQRAPGHRGHRRLQC